MKKKKLHLDFGARMIILYMVFAYAIPSILVSIIGTLPGNYKDVVFNWPAFFILLSAFSGYFILSNIPLFPRHKNAVRYEFRYINVRFQVLILSALVSVSVFGALDGLNVFRYGDVAISDRGSGLVLIYAVVPTVLNFHLMICLFFEQESSLRRGTQLIIRDVLLVIGLFLSANGVATMLSALFAFGYAISPQFIRNIVCSEDKKNELGRFRRRLFFLLFLAIVCTFAWVLGNTIKVGTGLEGGLSLIPKEEIFDWATTWATDRAAPSWISLRIALDKYAFGTDWSVLYEHFLAPLRNFFFRLDFLIMNVFDVEKPVIGSIMRINYLMITEEAVQAERQGTAPGLLAGFLISFPFPLNFMMLAGYLVFLQAFLSRIVSGVRRKLTFFGWCLLLYSLLAAFASPIDLLAILDDAAFGMVLLVCLQLIFIRRISGQKVQINYGLVSPNPMT